MAKSFQFGDALLRSDKQVFVFFLIFHRFRGFRPTCIFIVCLSFKNRPIPRPFSFFCFFLKIFSQLIKPFLGKKGPKIKKKKKKKKKTKFFFEKISNQEKKKEGRKKWGFYFGVEGL